MRAHWVTVEHDFSAPVDRVFAHFSEHENLGDLLDAQVDRLGDGELHRNGVGSRRRIRIGPLPPFEEIITRFEPGELIEYRITKGSPLLHDHVGVLRFSALPGGGTHVDYRIRIASRVPAVALLVNAATTRTLARGMTAADGRV